MPRNCWWALGVTVFLSAEDLAVLNTGAKVRTISDTNAMISEHQNQGQITLKMTKEMIALFQVHFKSKQRCGPRNNFMCLCPLVFKLDQHWSTQHPSLGLVLCFIAFCTLPRPNRGLNKQLGVGFAIWTYLKWIHNVPCFLASHSSHELQRCSWPSWDVGNNIKSRVAMDNPFQHLQISASFQWRWHKYYWHDA